MVMSHETYLTCRRERTNAKTHNFWSFKKFTERLACTAEEYGISVEVRSEAWTSQECPQCGSTDRPTRHQDTLTCPCGFEGHADLTAFARRVRLARPREPSVLGTSETFLKRHQNSESSDWRNETRSVSSTAHRDGSQADGTARAVPVRRPRLVGVTTLSRKSQRTAHRPEYRPSWRECCFGVVRKSEISVMTRISDSRTKSA